jgi:hypothetical protein
MKSISTALSTWSAGVSALALIPRRCQGRLGRRPCHVRPEARPFRAHGPVRLLRGFQHPATENLHRLKPLHFLQTLRAVGDGEQQGLGVLPIEVLEHPAEGLEWGKGRSGVIGHGR